MVQNLNGWVASIIRVGATTKEDEATVYGEVTGFELSGCKVSGLGLVAILV